MTALWEQKRQEVDAIVDAIVEISDGKSEDELMSTIAALARYAAQNLSADARKQWMNMLEKQVKELTEELTA